MPGILPLDKMAMELEDIANDISNNGEREKVYPWDRMADALTIIAKAVGVTPPTKKYSTKKAMCAEILQLIAEADVKLGSKNVRPFNVFDEYHKYADGVVLEGQGGMDLTAPFQKNLTKLSSTVGRIIGGMFDSSYSNLQELYLPNCTHVGGTQENPAISGLDSLKLLDMPMAQTIWTVSRNNGYYADAIVPSVKLNTFILGVKEFNHIAFPYESQLKALILPNIEYMRTNYDGDTFGNIKYIYIGPNFKRDDEESVSWLKGWGLDENVVWDFGFSREYIDCGETRYGDQNGYENGRGIVNYNIPAPRWSYAAQAIIE